MLGALLKSLLGGGGDQAKADQMVQPEQGGSPESPAIGVPKTPLIADSPKSEGPAGKQSLLDHVMFSLLGTNDAILTPQAQAKHSANRQKASAAANRAMESGGDESFMSPPTANGSSFGQMLSKIMSVVR